MPQAFFVFSSNFIEWAAEFETMLLFALWVSFFAVAPFLLSFMKLNLKELADEPLALLMLCSIIYIYNSSFVKVYNSS